MLNWMEENPVDKLTDEQLEARKADIDRKLAELQETSRRIDNEVSQFNCDLWVIEQEKKERLRKGGKSNPEAVRLLIDTFLLVDTNKFEVSRQAVRKWLRALPGVIKIDYSPTVECEAHDGDESDCEWEE